VNVEAGELQTVQSTIAERVRAQLGLFALLLAITGIAATIVKARYMPHYADSADSADPGFNSPVWRLVEGASLFLFPAEVLIALASIRQRAAKLALLGSVVHLVIFIGDLPSWIPDF
jgi:hypothetical protein